ncbi:MAG: hypothetical protein J0I66_08395 [Microbacterium sp.]|nr:hypothetical protein [Microbacterium sp.]
MPGRDVEALQALLGPGALPSRRRPAAERGVTLPPLTDHHVHLHLIDAAALVRGGIAGAVDLGGDPALLARRAAARMPHVAYAGAFLTAPGGYPFGRPWAPDAIVRAVTSADPAPGVAGGARTCVDEQADAGASVIKVSLNADGGPVIDDPALDAVVSAAHARGLPVVAHVEGAGTTRRAVEAGVDVLAHTPFTEVLDPELVARAALAGQRWISTLSIPGIDAGIAGANLSAFVDAGGRVLYGTDLGNGDRPAGIVVQELVALHRAGVRGPDLLATLTDPWPLARIGAGVATFVAGPPPPDADAVPEWLAGARVVPEEELIRDES